MGNPTVDLAKEHIKLITRLDFHFFGDRIRHKDTSMPAGVVLRVWDCRSLETSPKLPTLGSSEACAVLWPALHSGAARFRISPGAVVQEPSSMVAEPQRRRLSDVLPVSVCVCVHPWTKGSQPTSAGACSICGPLHATKLRPQMGRDQGRLILYLLCFHKL